MSQSLVTQRTLTEYQNECERCGESSDDVEELFDELLCWECRVKRTDEFIAEVEQDLAEGLSCA